MENLKRVCYAVFFFGLLFTYLSTSALADRAELSTDVEDGRVIQGLSCSAEARDAWVQQCRDNEAGHLWGHPDISSGNEEVDECWLDYFCNEDYCRHFGECCRAELGDDSDCSADERACLDHYGDQLENCLEDANSPENRSEYSIME